MPVHTAGFNPVAIMVIVGLFVLAAVVLGLYTAYAAIERRVRWLPWARRHDYEWDVPVDADWGEPFGGTQSNRETYVGVERGMPMAVMVHSRRTMDVERTERAIVCVMRLRRNLGTGQVVRHDAPPDLHPEGVVATANSPWAVTADNPALRAALESPDMTRHLFASEAVTVRIVGDQVVAVAAKARETPARMDALVAFTGGVVDRLTALLPAR